MSLRLFCRRPAYCGSVTAAALQGLSSPALHVAPSRRFVKSVTVASELFTARLFADTVSLVEVVIRRRLAVAPVPVVSPANTAHLMFSAALPLNTVLQPPSVPKLSGPEIAFACAGRN